MLTPARRLARPRSRIEYFVFSLLAEMQGHEVQLYAIKRNGVLNRYPTVKVLREEYMPSGGDLSNPNDQALVKGLEDQMIDAYGTALVELKCKAAGGKKVDLSSKMLRPQHVGALFAAVERYQVTKLNLGRNQLGAEGGALVVEALKTNTTLSWLECAQLGWPSNHEGTRVGLPWLDGGHGSMHSPLLTLTCAVCAGSTGTSSAPRVAWRSPRRSRATTPSSTSCLLPCHRTRPPMCTASCFPV